MRAYLEIKVGAHVTMIDLKPEMEEVESIIDVDFGHVKVQIANNKDNSWRVVNAVNGHGINCKEEYQKKEVTVKQVNN